MKITCAHKFGLCIGATARVLILIYLVWAVLYYNLKVD